MRGKCETHQESKGYKVRFGETPKPACESGALVRDSRGKRVCVRF